MQKLEKQVQDANKRDIGAFGWGTNNVPWSEEITSNGFFVDLVMEIFSSPPVLLRHPIITVFT